MGESRQCRDEEAKFKMAKVHVSERKIKNPLDVQSSDRQIAYQSGSRGIRFIPNHLPSGAQRRLDLSEICKPPSA